MTSKRSGGFYLERDIDEQLWLGAQAWVASRAEIQWISLISVPGRGNTSLLTYFEKLVSRDSDFRKDTRVIRTEGRDIEAGGRPPGLYPIAAQVHRLSSEAQVSAFRRFSLRIRNCGAGRLTLIALVFLTLFTCACVLQGFSEYVKDKPQLLAVSWWRTFFLEFLSKNFLDLPFWFLANTIVSLPLSLGFIFFVRRMLPGAPSTKPSPEQMQELSAYQDSFIRALDLVCQARSRLVLLIDDAYALPVEEKRFLESLLNPPVEERELRRFCRKHSILVVTLDTETSHWPVPETMQNRFKSLKVPPFALFEAQQIAQSKLPDDEGRRVPEWLEEAQKNINTLFAPDSADRLRHIREEFEAAKSDIAGDFGLAEMLAYWVVSGEPFVTKGALRDWLAALDPGHLAAFSLRPPQNLVELVKRFAASSVVRQDGQTCYLSAASCMAWRDWLQRERGDLLIQAHCFWCWTLWNPLSHKQAHPADISRLPASGRNALKQAGWHTARLRLAAPSASECLAPASLAPDERQRRRTRVIATLLAATQVRREEGNLNEASRLLAEAFGWLRSPGWPPEPEWLERAAEGLWSNYWLWGDPETERTIDALAAESPELVGSVLWQVHRRLLEFFKAGDNPSEQVVEPPSDRPDLVNLHRLTETLRAVRRSHGLLSPALQDRSISIAEPVADPRAGTAEFSLRQLHAAALNQRNETEHLKRALQDWRARLLRSKPDVPGMGVEAVHSYHVARYWHMLAETARSGLKRVAERPEGERPAARQAILADLAALCLEPPAPSAELADHIFERAEQLYERALRLGVLLQLWPLVMEASFHFGSLLERHMPARLRVGEPPWWERWETLFEKCMDVERRLGWIVHEPAIHHIRWQFFQHLDQPTSVNDAYNAFEAMKRARFPESVILRWHQMVSALLNDYGDSQEDRKRSAKLFEMWACDLAVLDEAIQYRVFKKCLPLEQAHALGYAAQSRRLAEEFDLAERLLQKATRCVDRAAADPAARHEPPGAVRDLSISLKMQRAWLASAQKRGPEHKRLIHEIWSELERDDRVCPNVLLSLVQIEAEQRLLEKAWPPSVEVARHADPENDRLSLPPSWFAEGTEVPFQNRFEFRFLQLVSFISPFRAPLVGDLIMSAGRRWFGRESFGDVALAFSEIDRRGQFAAATRPIMVSLLQAVRLYFAEIDEQDRQELRALRSLMWYEPTSSTFRDDYVAVLKEHEELLKRELESQATAEQRDWMAAADLVHNYLDVLVDPNMFRDRCGQEILRRGVSAEQFVESRKHRLRVLEKARTAYDAGDVKDCLARLQAILPAETPFWVFHEDLEILDLWLRCAATSGLQAPRGIGARARQLQALALSYIEQFSLVIPEPDVQNLTLNLLHVLRRWPATKA